MTKSSTSDIRDKDSDSAFDANDTCTIFQFREHDRVSDEPDTVKYCRNDDDDDGLPSGVSYYILCLGIYIQRLPVDLVTKSQMIYLYLTHIARCSIVCSHSAVHLS